MPSSTFRSASAGNAYYRDLLRPVFEGRRFIVIGGPIVGIAGVGASLRALGAERPFLLGEMKGTGRMPGPEAAEWTLVPVGGANMIERMHAFEAAIAEPPAPVCDALDRWDPDRRACAVGTVVLSPVPSVAGRRRYAARERSWAALEDKTVVDAFWDTAGVARAPSEVVAVDADALAAASARIERGADTGTVWAGDARDQIHGGGVYTRWIRTPEDAEAALRLFEPCCDRVRVMPFLEGIPCSVHGIVLPDGVVVLRPVEAITLRRAEPSGLAYSGVATFWDPTPADREQIRAVARTTGEALRRKLGYRGPFTVDGVVSDEGFRPTELNPRFGAALGVLAGCVPDLPLIPLCIAALEGEPLDYRAEALEALALEGVDRRRGGGGWLVVPGESARETLRFKLRETGSGWVRSEACETPDATVLVGEGDGGRFVRVTPDPERVSPGPSLAPRVARALAWVDRELGLGLGPLEPAREVRSGRDTAREDLLGE